MRKCTEFHEISRNFTVKMPRNSVYCLQTSGFRRKSKNHFRRKPPTRVVTILELFFKTSRKLQGQEEQQGLCKKIHAQ
jgi:hypothetical protein